MLRLAIVTKTSNNAVWWYRVLPWLYLGRQNRQINITSVSNQNMQSFEAMIGAFDVLVIHCPSTKRDYDCILKAREMGVNVLVDYDDLITSVPGVNSASNYYDNPDVQENVLECYKLANFVTVSTEHLAKQFQESFGAKPDVINNAHNDFILGAFPTAHNEAQNGVSTILWRGSDTHQGDLMRYRYAIEERENIDWHFWGAKPDLIVSKKWGGNLETWTHKPWRHSVPNYFQSLRLLKPQFLFVPLVDDSFNRSKSGIAWLEATYCGAICLASDLPEFKHAYTFTDPSDLMNVLDFIDTNSFDFTNYFANSRAIIYEKFLLSIVNQRRAEALDKMLSL